MIFYVKIIFVRDVNYMSVKKEFETQELNNKKEIKKKKQHFMFYKFVSFLTIVLTVISICYILLALLLYL